FLARLMMRRGIGTEKKLFRTTGNNVAQRLLVCAALEYRQAVVVRTNSAGEQVIAVHHQVLRRNGRCHTIRCLADKVRRIAGGDVLEHHFQLRETLHQWRKTLVDKRLLAIEDIDMGISDLTMYQQQHAGLAECLDYRRSAEHTSELQSREKLVC